MASHGIFLGDNQLKGWLPGQWSSAFLQELDLGNNLLSGLLPTSWGDKTALPSLFALNLAGNQLRGAWQGRGSGRSRLAAGAAVLVDTRQAGCLSCAAVCGVQGQCPTPNGPLWALRHPATCTPDPSIPFCAVSRARCPAQPGNPRAGNLGRRCWSPTASKLPAAKLKLGPRAARLLCQSLCRLPALCTSSPDPFAVPVFASRVLPACPRSPSPTRPHTYTCASPQARCWSWIPSCTTTVLCSTPRWWAGCGQLGGAVLRRARLAGGAERACQACMKLSGHLPNLAVHLGAKLAVTTCPPSLPPAAELHREEASERAAEQHDHAGGVGDGAVWGGGHREHHQHPGLLLPALLRCVCVGVGGCWHAGGAEPHNMLALLLQHIWATRLLMSGLPYTCVHAEAGMKPDSAAVTTNFYDMTWQLNVRQVLTVCGGGARHSAAGSQPASWVPGAAAFGASLSDMRARAPCLQRLRLVEPEPTGQHGAAGRRAGAALLPSRPGGPGPVLLWRQHRVPAGKNMQLLGHTGCCWLGRCCRCCRHGSGSHTACA